MKHLCRAAKLGLMVTAAAIVIVIVAVCVLGGCLLIHACMQLVVWQGWGGVFIIAAIIVFAYSTCIIYRNLQLGLPWDHVNF